MNSWEATYFDLSERKLFSLAKRAKEVGIFQVASFGVLGYECNLCDLKKEELAAIQAQISLYKQWREVLQFGQFYRGRTFSDREAERHSVSLDPSGHNEMEWTIAAKDRKSAVGLLLQSLVVPNRPHTIFHVYGLQEDRCYHFCNRPLQVNVKEFGDLVNTIAPVHIVRLRLHTIWWRSL